MPNLSSLISVVRLPHLGFWVIQTSVSLIMADLAIASPVEAGSEQPNPSSTLRETVLDSELEYLERVTNPLSVIPTNHQDNQSGVAPLNSSSTTTAAQTVDPEAVSSTAVSPTLPTSTAAQDVREGATTSDAQILAHSTDEPISTSPIDEGRLNDVADRAALNDLSDSNLSDSNLSAPNLSAQAEPQWNTAIAPTIPPSPASDNRIVNSVVLPVPSAPVAPPPTTAERAGRAANSFSPPLIAPQQENAVPLALFAAPAPQPIIPQPVLSQPALSQPALSPVLSRVAIAPQPVAPSIIASPQPNAFAPGQFSPLFPEGPAAPAPVQWITQAAPSNPAPIPTVTPPPARNGAPLPPPPTAPMVPMPVAPGMAIPYPGMMQVPYMVPAPGVMGYPGVVMPYPGAGLVYPGAVPYAVPGMMQPYAVPGFTATPTVSYPSAPQGFISPQSLMNPQGTLITPNPGVLPGSPTLPIPMSQVPGGISNPAGIVFPGMGVPQIPPGTVSQVPNGVVQPPTTQVPQSQPAPGGVFAPLPASATPSPTFTQPATLNPQTAQPTFNPIAPPPNRLIPSTAITPPVLLLQGAALYIEDEFSARARVSAAYPVTPNFLVGATLDLNAGNALGEEGVNITELYAAASLQGLPGFRIALGQLDLTSYFDRNSFAKDATTHFFNPTFQTNPALSAANIGSRQGVVVNWSLTDTIEARVAGFSSDQAISDFDFDGFAAELGFRFGNAIIRGTYVSSNDDDAPEDADSSRLDAYGVNAEVFIPELNLGLFGRYGAVDASGRDFDADTFSGGFNFLDVFQPFDRLGLAYGRNLSDEGARREAGGEIPDVLELFYDFRLLPNLRLGFSLQQRNEFSETFAGFRVKTEFDVTPRGLLGQ